MIKTDIFKTAIYSDNFSLNNTTLRELVNNVEENFSSENISNLGGYHSINLLNESINFLSKEQLTELTSLVSKVEIFGNDIIKNFSPVKNLKIGNIWFNKSYNKDFNIPHIHPNSILSGVYYCKTSQDCGPLVFDRPDKLLVQSYFQNFFSNLNEYNYEVYTILPEDGLCVLFPSYLTHSVMPNLSNSARVSFSFNLSF